MIDSLIISSLEHGDYYAAHQRILSISQRKIKSQNIEDARTVLMEGLSKLLEHQQTMSALDLCKKLIETQPDPIILADYVYKFYSINPELSDELISKSVQVEIKNLNLFLTNYTIKLSQGIHTVYLRLSFVVE